MTISYNLIIRNYIIFEGARMSTHLHIELMLRMSGVLPYAFKAFMEANPYFYRNEESE